MITSPLVDGSVAGQVIITLKNGWSIGARAADTAYVYPRGEATKVCKIKVNSLILPAEDVDFLYFQGVVRKLILDPKVPGGVTWTTL